MEGNYTKMDLCEECQIKFDKQLGELLLFDMCEECTTKALLSIAETKKKENKRKQKRESQVNPNTLGKFLRSERLGRGMTGREVAEITGVNQSRISQIELGYVHSPSVTIIKNLSKFLNKTPLEIAEMIDLKSIPVQMFIEREKRI